MGNEAHHLLVPALAASNSGHGILDGQTSDGETAILARGDWGGFAARIDGGSVCVCFHRRRRRRSHERSRLGRKCARELLDVVLPWAAGDIRNMHLGALEYPAILGRPCHRAAKPQHPARIDDA